MRAGEDDLAAQLSTVRTVQPAAGIGGGRRCETFRGRHARPGAPGFRRLRTLEQLALLLISTGELSAAGLQLLPSRAPPG
jgi:hypothetical protein